MQNNNLQSIPEEFREDFKQQIINKVGSLRESRFNCGRFFLYFENTLINIKCVLRNIDDITEEEFQVFQDVFDYSKPFFQHEKPAIAFYNDFYNGRITFSMKLFNKAIEILFYIQKRHFESFFKSCYKEFNLDENSSNDIIEERREEVLNLVKKEIRGSHFILSKAIDTIKTSMQNELELLHSNIKKSGIAWRKIDEYKETYNLSDAAITQAEKYILQQMKIKMPRGNKINQEVK